MYVDNIIRSMNTKHERCDMAFLLQAAHWQDCSQISSQQKPNCCFSEQRGYYGCM